MKTLVALAVLFCLSIQSFALTKAEAKTIYNTDKSKVLSGDLTFDWKEFRLAAKQGGAGYFDWHPVRTKFMQEIDKGDFKAALNSANEIMQHNMAEPEGHLLALVAYQKLGQEQDAHLQHQVVDAYLQSILSSGDGKSAKTAFFVVDEGEEYFYLNIVLGIGLPASQSLVVKDGHSFDLLKVKDKDNNEQEVWFNVDTSMNAMRDALGEANKK
jgi:hypothetical protein